MAEQTQSKVPEIRFSGFDGEWDVCALGDTCLIGDIDHRMPVSVSVGIPYIMTGDFYGINKIDFDNAKLISPEDYAQFSRKIKPEKGDILFARYASIGAVRLVETDKQFLISYSCAILKKSRTHNSEYLFYYLQSNSAKKQIETAINTGSQGNVGIDTLKRLPVFYPRTIAQNNIASYLRTIDAMISQHQQKHAKLVALKKAMLQKMFPRDGATTPEIRFKGFSGDWEEKALGEVCRAAYGGGTPSTSVEAYWRGHIPWIQSSDLTSDNVFQVSPRKHISEEAIRKSATKLVPANSLAVVTRVGVGKLVFIPFEYATSQDFLSLSDLLIDGSFLAYAGMVVLRRKLHEVQGTSIKGLTKEELLSVTIFAPHDEHEQRSVGRYFKELDELVKVHATQISKLRNIKAACLEKMFV